MKSLSLNQMENVNGGNALMACAGGVAATTIGIAATILTAGLFGFGAVLAVGFTAASCSLAASEFGR